MIKELSGKEFDLFIKKGNVVVDFAADWCMPCKIMEPQIKKAAEKLKEIKFGKVDVDDENDLAMRFEVRSIPTTIFFKDGEVVDQHTGAMTADMIERTAKEAFG